MAHCKGRLAVSDRSPKTCENELVSAAELVRRVNEVKRHGALQSEARDRALKAIRDRRRFVPKSISDSQAADIQTSF